MVLTRGMFGTELAPIEVFGIFCGQMRSGEHKLCHNAGWYNREGEKLGWGDLSSGDFRTLLSAIAPDQFFILLPEQKSFFEFTKFDGPDIVEVAPAEQNPGKDYVAEHYRFALTSEIIYLPLTYPYVKPGEVMGRVAKMVGKKTVMLAQGELRKLL
jgi:hypothetical protein